MVFLQLFLSRLPDLVPYKKISRRHRNPVKLFDFFYTRFKQFTFIRSHSLFLQCYRVHFILWVCTYIVWKCRVCVTYFALTAITNWKRDNKYAKQSLEKKKIPYYFNHIVTMWKRTTKEKSWLKYDRLLTVQFLHFTVGTFVKLVVSGIQSLQKRFSTIVILYSRCTNGCSKKHFLPSSFKRGVICRLL